MKHSIWWLTSLVFLSGPITLFAADENPDFYQSIGKIYVVVTVIALIFLGLAYYLYRMDTRITAIEKQKKHES